MSQRKLWGFNSFRSASDLGHWNLPLDSRLYRRI